MTTQQDYNLQATQGIEFLAQKLRAMLKTPMIKSFLRETPDEITGGKDLYQLAMDDLLVAFEYIYREQDAKDTPLNVYQAILRHAEPELNLTKTEDLISYLEQRREDSVAAQYFFENDIPRYLKILEKKVTPDSFEKLAQDHVNLLSDITNAGVPTELQNVFSKNADIQKSVSDRVDDLFDEITSEDNIIEFDFDLDSEEADEIFAELDDKIEADREVEEEENKDTTVLDPSIEKFLKLYSKDKREEARDKHQARRLYSENTNTDLEDIKYTPVDEALLNVATTLMMTPTQSSMIMVAEKGMDTSGIVTRLSEQLYHDAVPQALGGARIIELDLEKMMNFLSNTPSGMQDPDIGDDPVNMTMLEAKLHVIVKSIDQHNKSGKPPIFLSVKGFEQAVKPKSIMGGVLDDFFTYWLGDDKDVRIIAEVSKDGIEAIKKETPDLFKLLNTHVLKEQSERDIVARIKDWAYFGRGKPLTDEYIISPEIIESIVKLSTKHVSTESEVQPGLSASILTLATTAANKRGSTEVSQDDVIEAIMTRSGKSRDMIATNENAKMATLNSFVKENLINQDHAVDKITSKFDLIRAKRKRKGKPIGVFMCTGPTGVGKTEVAKLISEHLGAGFIPLDMSNYSSEHTVSQILGSPAGYVGYGNKTPLEATAENDINVVLLDEFEKSHPDIYKAFMAAFDEGRLQTRDNKTLNFENTLFLLTSNIGEQNKQNAKSNPGFGGGTKADAEKNAKSGEINRRYPPEFKNRVDGIIDFNDLNKEAIEKIAKLKLKKLAKGYEAEQQHGEFKISQKAFDQLVEKSFVPGMGARPLEREIEELIDLPLGQWVLNNEDKDPMKYKFTVNEVYPELKLDVAPLPEKSVAVTATNENSDKPAAPSQKLG